ncbi:unnamed protein product [Calypogeia fissa]
MEEKYDPKIRGLPVSWKNLQRKLPRTLSTFQILLLAGFLSLLVMRSSIGIASLNFGSQYMTAADDEYAKGEQSRLKVADVEPRRTLVQTEDFNEIDKFEKTVQKNDEVEQEDEMDRQIAEHHLDETKKPNPSKTTKETTKGTTIFKDEQPRKAVENKKPVVQPKEVVEDFDQVEAELGEEETAEDLEKFQKGVKEEQVTQVAESEEEQKTVDPKPKTENQAAAEQKTTEMENPTQQKEEITEPQRTISEGQNSAEEKKSEEYESVDAKEGDKNGKDSTETTVEEPKKLTPEELKAFTAEAIANMSKLTRRDHPDAFTLGPKITDWDQQRAAWLEKNPDMKNTDPHKPKVLLLTGSQPWPCHSSVGDHYLLKMIKNKVDYARIHKIEIFYNFAHLDKQMSHFWAKLPIIRKMMLMQPEIEWIFWMDSDAFFTDMVFEIPFERYQDYNFVMWGIRDILYGERSWVACNTGVMFLRNNQWTLDLLEVWSHMGPEGKIRNETGKIMTRYLTQRAEMTADDQSALVFLMLTMPELRPKIALEDEYLLSGYWVDLVGKYEEFSEKSRPGAGGRNWPFTTHFTGCQPCSGVSNELYEGNACLDGMEKAFNFADNQVLRPFGFEHENLCGAKVLRIRNESTKPIWQVPVDNPWAVQSFYS